MPYRPGQNARTARRISPAGCGRPLPSSYITDPNGYGIEVLYELPREVWEDDIDAVLNYAERLPTEGEEALVDQTDNIPRFGKA